MSRWTQWISTRIVVSTLVGDAALTLDALIEMKAQGHATKHQRGREKPYGGPLDGELMSSRLARMRPQSVPSFVGSKQYRRPAQYNHHA